MPTIDLANLMEQIGLEQYNIQRPEAANYFMPASVVAYSDGELMIQHGPLTDRLAEWYGEHSFNDGLVAQGLHAAAVKNGRTPGEIVNHQLFTAQYFLGMLSTIFIPEKPVSGVQLHNELITFDNLLFSLAKPPELIVDYGPGVAGLSHTEAQARMVHNHQQPYRYLPICRLPFTNQVLINSYDHYLGEGSAKAFMHNQFYVGREDGIAAATNELIAEQTANAGSAEIADLVIASGIYAADKDEVLTGMRNAYTFLRDGGALIIRSIAEPRDGEVGADEMISTAHEAGFDSRKTQSFRVLTGGLGALMLNGGQHRRSISAILIK